MSGVGMMLGIKMLGIKMLGIKMLDIKILLYYDIKIL